MALVSPLEYTGLPRKHPLDRERTSREQEKVGFQMILPPSAGIVDESKAPS